jgi:hypothetical protein
MKEVCIDRKLTIFYFLSLFWPKSAKVTYDIIILPTSQDVFSPWLNCPRKMLKSNPLPFQIE